MLTDKINLFFSSLKNIAIIGALVILLWLAISLKENLTSYLADSLKYQNQQNAEVGLLMQNIKDLKSSYQNFSTKAAEEKVKGQEIKMDIGKEIRDFNKGVKEIKNVTDSKESYKRLADAWDAYKSK